MEGGISAAPAAQCVRHCLVDTHQCNPAKRFSGRNIFSLLTRVLYFLRGALIFLRERDFSLKTTRRVHLGSASMMLDELLDLFQPVFFVVRKRRRGCHSNACVSLNSCQFQFRLQALSHLTVQVKTSHKYKLSYGVS